MCSGSEAGSYLRLIDSCITQLKAQGPSRTCNESKEEEDERCSDGAHCSARTTNDKTPPGRNRVTNPSFQRGTLTSCANNTGGRPQKLTRERMREVIEGDACEALGGDVPDARIIRLAHAPPAMQLIA